MKQMEIEEGRPPPGIETGEGDRPSSHSHHHHRSINAPQWTKKCDKKKVLYTVVAVLIIILLFIIIAVATSGGGGGKKEPAVQEGGGGGATNTTTSGSGSAGSEPPSTASPSSSAAALSASFLTDTRQTERLRQWLVDNVNTSRIDALVKEYSRLPHIAGSQRNTELAQKTANYFRSWGFDDVRIQEIPVLLMTLQNRSVNVTNPSTGQVTYRCSLDEVNVVNQSDWGKALPPTNGYTASGRVENAPVVWANYGREEDFAAIANVNLTGTVVVMRYTKIFRGNKVKAAMQRGAAGVILTFDPADVVKGPVFPQGPWANNASVQRGSIFMGEGDPLTPSWPSQFGGPALTLEDLYDEELMDGSPLPTIPVQPMGYGDARHVLQQLGGTSLPTNQDWQDTGFKSLFANGIGPGPATVSMEVKRTLKTFTISNVFGTIKGSVEPDRTVILGNHRDAWTYGAVDPISGHSTTLEIARLLGSLHTQHGWTPRRTIEICSWDAEEWGILGSVEYVETAIELLRQRAVLYLNLDTSVCGTDYLFSKGSPSLAPFISEVASLIPHPTNQSATLQDMALPYSPAGAGSDHIGFLQIAGVPVYYGGMDNRSSSYEGVYHSNYDNYVWSSKFGDPGFLFHGAMAQFYGSILLHVADANLLPFSMDSYASSVQQWVADYKTQVAADAQLKPMLDAGDLNFTFIEGCTSSFATAAKNFELGTLYPLTQQVAKIVDQTDTAIAVAAPMNPYQLRAANDAMMGLERVFLGNGKKETAAHWYKHVLFTPSAVNSYGSTVMPLIAEALQTKDASKINFAMGRVGQFIARAGLFVNSTSVLPP